MDELISRQAAQRVRTARRKRGGMQKNRRQRYTVHKPNSRMPAIFPVGLVSRADGDRAGNPDPAAGRRAKRVPAETAEKDRRKRGGSVMSSGG